MSHDVQRGAFVRSDTKTSLHPSKHIAVDVSSALAELVKLALGYISLGTDEGDRYYLPFCVQRPI